MACYHFFFSQTLQICFFSFCLSIISLIMLLIFCSSIKTIRLWCTVFRPALDPKAWIWSLHWTTCTFCSFSESLRSGREFPFLRSIWWCFYKHASMHVSTVSILQNTFFTLIVCDFSIGLYNKRYPSGTFPQSNSASSNALTYEI